MLSIESNRRLLAMLLVPILAWLLLSPRLEAQGGTHGVPADRRPSEKNSTAVPSSNWNP